MTGLRGEVAAQIAHLRRYARALTGHPDNADDLVQECLARAYSRLHLWREGSDLRRWLFTIMHNLHVNAHRRAARVPPTVPLEDVEHGLAQHTGPLDELRLDELRRAFDLLPVEQRQVLFLVSVEGMRYAEVAESLDVPIGTVMSRLHRARQRLRDVLEGQANTTLRAVK